MQEYMIQKGFWSLDEESELSTAGKRMDTLKEEMFNHYAAFKSAQVEKFRQLLLKLRLRAGELFKKKHAYDINTCSGLAMVYQLQFLLSRNVIDSEGNLITDIDDYFIKALCEQYVANRPSDHEIRQISKMDLWRGIWHASKGSTSVFGVSGVALSDEQRSLLGWTRLYDNVNEAASPPVKVVLDDDDLLDGWLIVQHKKQEAEKQGNNDARNIQPNAQEVFIPAETNEDARRIEAMNDIDSQLMKRQRTQLVKTYGKIEEQDLPSSKQEILMQATQAFADRVRNR